MSNSDTPSSAQLAGEWKGEAPPFSEWMHFTLLVTMVILPI